MKEKFKKFLEDAFYKGVYEVVKCLLLIVFSSGIFGLIAHAVTVNISFLAPYVLYITVFFSAGGAFFCIILYERLSLRKPRFPKLEFHFRIIEKEYTYEYKDKNHMIFTKRIKLKALKNNLDRYHDRYCWSGLGNVLVRSEVKDQIFLSMGRKDVYHEYEILFGRNLKKGEEIETCIVFELEDLQGQAIPFLSTTISEPTQYQILRVIIPKSLGVEKAVAEIKPCTDSYIPIDTELINFNVSGEAKWETKKPRLLYVYSIRWNL